MDALYRAQLLDKLMVEANEIIAKKHLEFDWFFGATSSYEYNCWVAHSSYYKKLIGREWFVLLVILKKEYNRLENWEEIYGKTL